MMQLPRPIRRLACLVWWHEPWIKMAGYRSLQFRCCGDHAFPPPAGQSVSVETGHWYPWHRVAPAMWD